MDEVLLVALAGFAAAMVDGALGMGFGPTSATLLLGAGVSPGATSAMVNLAKVATGLASAVSHWRFDNVDRRLVVQLAVPGAAGAVAGAVVLTAVDGDALRPALALLLILIGLQILDRFSRPLPAPRVPSPADAGGSADDVKGARWVGAAGGCTNGLVGAWGPVVTPFLLNRGIPPRYAVGSVNTAEVAVAIVSAGSVMTSLGGDGIDLALVGAMLCGGVLAAPLAAHLVRFLPARALGLAVAALLLSTQTRELSRAGLVPMPTWIAYLAIATMVTLSAARPRLRSRTGSGSGGRRSIRVARS